jgi:hypothetical protein
LLFHISNVIVQALICLAQVHPEEKPAPMELRGAIAVRDFCQYKGFTKTGLTGTVMLISA